MSKCPQPTRRAITATPTCTETSSYTWACCFEWVYEGLVRTRLLEAGSCSSFLAQPDPPNHPRNPPEDRACLGPVGPHRQVHILWKADSRVRGRHSSSQQVLLGRCVGSQTWLSGYPGTRDCGSEPV